MRSGTVRPGGGAAWGNAPPTANAEALRTWVNATAPHVPHAVAVRAVASEALRHETAVGLQHLARPATIAAARPRMPQLCACPPACADDLLPPHVPHAHGPAQLSGRRCEETRTDTHRHALSAVTDALSQTQRRTARHVQGHAMRACGLGPSGCHRCASPRATWRPPWPPPRPSAAQPR